MKSSTKIWLGVGAFVVAGAGVTDAASAQSAVNRLQTSESTSDLAMARALSPATDFSAAKKHGETDDRLAVVAGWREAPFFTDAERAALALAEAVTRLSDRSDPVPDAVWDEAATQYDEQKLAALVVAIANINLWNRLNVATRQVAGAYEW